MATPEKALARATKPDGRPWSCDTLRTGHGNVTKPDQGLIQNNRLDPDAQTVRELLLKHGTEELYEKVRRACRRD